MKKGAKKRVKVYDKEGLTILAKRLKEARAAKGWTQEELAYQSGIALSQIARIETVAGNPTLSTILILAKSLKILPETLIST